MTERVFPRNDTVQQATDEYDAENEQSFRQQLEISLGLISRDIDSLAAMKVDRQSSASRRSMFLGMARGEQG